MKNINKQQLKIKFSVWAQRDKIIKHRKDKPKTEGSHLVKEKSILDYEYYNCDYCGKEIKIADKWENQTGNIMELPASITNRGKIQIAIHNKCLKCFLKDLEE